MAPDDLEKAESAGAAPDRILLNGAAHEKAFLEKVLFDGSVGRFHLDSAERLELLLQLCRDTRKAPSASIGLRIHDGNSHFGFPFTKEVLQAAAAKLQSAGIAVRSLHVHTNHRSSIGPEEYASHYAQSLRRLLRASDWIGIQKPPLLDLGGGLDSPYVYRVPPSLLGEYHNPGTAESIRGKAGEWMRSCSLSALASSIGKALAKTLKEEQRDNAVAFEFGRSVCTRSLSTLLQVEAVKEGLYPEARIVLTNGNTAILGPLHREVHELTTVNGDGKKPRHTFVYGNLPHSGDWLFQNIRLPMLSPGDRIHIHATGAYTLSLEAKFGHELPVIVDAETGNEIGRT